MSKVAILGYGRFGRALGRLFEEAGVAHRAFDPHADVPLAHRTDSLNDLVSGAAFVVIAVPVPFMRDALVELRPYLNREQTVFDVGSVKVVPEAALAAVLGSEIPWCGTHPLFGPVSLALAERPLRVVICPAEKHPEAAARVEKLYQDIGCEVIEQTPESHDRVMAHTHALTFFVAKGMIDAGAGMSVQFAPPSFQALARTIETVRSDGGHLFAAIARDNPFAAEARKELVRALDAIDQTLDAQSAYDETAAEERISIPPLGERSPELLQAREHIDEIDHAIVRLLAQRAELQTRAAQAKAKLGAPILDRAREAEVLAERRKWAEQSKLDPDGTADVFKAIVTMSRRAQRG
jgi:prephenate dehydrogenase